jgi:lysophospholipase L1-like esterase
VTNGGGVNRRTNEWYQNVFAERLRERFPQAKVTLHTAAWGGRSSRNYLEAPRGGEKDFVRDVLEPKPDMVTIEFVNDAYLDEEATQVHYAGILERLESIGAEVVLITPHFVRPDWMGVSTMKIDEDPRPYVRGLRRFAAEHNLALADASARWCRLWRQGIPYITLEANWINHPDARGHELFAEALLALFPEE